LETIKIIVVYQGNRVLWNEPHAKVLEESQMELVSYTLAFGSAFLTSGKKLKRHRLQILFLLSV
jgi:hypothetical protein